MGKILPQGFSKIHQEREASTELREDYEASFDTRDTLDARHAIPSVIEVENAADAQLEATNKEGSLDLLTGVLGDLAKKRDEEEDEAAEDGSKTLLPGSTIEVGKDESDDEGSVSQENACKVEARERKENEASVRNEEDVLLKSWELDRRREDIDVECVVEEPLAEAEIMMDIVSEEEIQEAYAVIENSVSETNRSRIEIIQAVEQLSEKLDEENSHDDNVKSMTKEIDEDEKETDKKHDEEEVILRSRTLSGSSSPPCRLSDTFCDEIFSELSGTLDRPYPGLSTTSRNKPIISDLSKTFPETNAEHLLPKLPGENRVPEQYRNMSEVDEQNSMQESLLADSSLIPTSRIPDGQNFSKALSLSSSLVLKSSRTPPPSPISPSPPSDQSFSHTSASTEGEARSETLASAPQGCIFVEYTPLVLHLFAVHIQEFLGCLFPH